MENRRAYVNLCIFPEVFGPFWSVFEGLARNGRHERTQLAILRACKNIGGRDALKVLINASVSGDPTVSRLASNLLSE